MKILYTLDSGNPGGMEQHVLDLVRGFVAKGDSVYVWCRAGMIDTWYKEAGALVTIISIHTDIDPVYIIKLIRFILKNKIDIIHSHELKASANSLIAAFVANTPVRVSHIHTPLSEWKHATALKSAFSKIVSRLYSFEVNMLGGKEVALTESRKRIKMKEGIMGNKITIIPNGLDLQRFDLSDDHRQQFRTEIRNKFGIPLETYVFGNVSRLTAEKGHKTLLTAFKKFLRKNGDGHHLFIAGGGVLAGEVIEMVNRLGLSSNVTVTGIFDAADLPKFYCAFDSFVFPSSAEGFGFVLIEAMYNGLPCLCTDIEVLREVSGNYALFFKPYDADDLARKLEILINADDERRSAVLSAKSLVETKYNMKSFISNYAELYADLYKGAVKS